MDSFSQILEEGHIMSENLRTMVNTRPGRKPKIPDHERSPRELEEIRLRRERNKASGK